MKKSKIVSIGLLALSLSACHKHRVKVYQDWNDYQNNPTYYVNDGYGYHNGGVSPFWIYWAYQMGSNNRIYASPGYVYRSYNGGYVSTYGGSRTAMSSRSFRSSGGLSSHSTISRGGFGSSGSHASSGS